LYIFKKHPKFLPIPFSIKPQNTSQSLSEYPLVTVVIPTYNRLDFVQQAIASVVAQTYTNWELFVVDDGSDDGTSEAVISMNDVRIRLLKMKHVGNIAKLRNTGVQAGSGGWLAFLDSDDIWVPQKLEIQLHRMLQTGNCWGYGRFELMNKEMQTIPNKAGIYYPYSGWIAKKILTTEASVNIGTLLLERTLFEEVGGFNSAEELLFREDYELVLRLALRAEALAVPELLVRVREHVSRSTNVFDYGHDRTAAMYEHFIRTHPEKELEKIAKRRMAGELAESAVQRIKQRKYIEACRRLLKAFINGDHLRHLLSAVRRGFSASTGLRHL
jgi:glycosyltransferase involved in cell wall biosynthesis